MRLQSGAVSPRVLHRHDEANRSAVLSGERLSLGIGATVLALKVPEKTLDLRGPDLGRAEQDEVDCLSVLADEQLNRRLPRRVRLTAQLLGQNELAGIAQGRRATGIRPEHEIETHRPGHRADRRLSSRSGRPARPEPRSMTRHRRDARPARRTSRARYGQGGHRLHSWSSAPERGVVWSSSASWPQHASRPLPARYRPLTARRIARSSRVHDRSVDRAIHRTPAHVRCPATRDACIGTCDRSLMRPAQGRSREDRPTRRARPASTRTRARAVHRP